MHRRFVTTCAIALSLLLSATAQEKRKTADDSGRLSSDVPNLVDPGFESFKLARAPLYGWFSDDMLYSHDTAFASVTMTPDSQIKVEGQYSLRIEQIRPRPMGRGQAFLAQAVRLPKRGGITRNFDLTMQMQGGLKGPVSIQVYVWEKGNIARAIAQRDVIVDRQWQTTTISFKVPEGHDQFGIWFYLPRDNEAQLWLDDIHLVPREAI